MDIKTLESTVFTTMADQLGISVSELSPGFDIVARGEADSLDLIELVMAFEEELGIEVSNEEAEAVRPVTPVNVVAFFSEKFNLSYDTDAIMAIQSVINKQLHEVAKQFVPMNKVKTNG